MSSDFVLKRAQPLRRFISTLLSSRAAKAGAILMAGILIFVFLGAYMVPFSPNAVTGSVNSPPSFAHPMGTDYVGHDLMSQVLWGGQLSLYIAIVSALGAVVIGFLSGVFAGYYTKLESVISVLTDATLTLPAIPAMILIALLFIPSNGLIILLLVAFLWAPISRAVRAQVLSVKRMPFVEAAQTDGLGDLRIVMRVIVPEVGALAVAYFIINSAVAIVITTALEFLGVGNPAVASWGSVLYWAQQYAFLYGDWWWVFAPGALLTLFAIGMALLGFSFEEMTNPRLRR